MSRPISQRFRHQNGLPPQPTVVSRKYASATMPVRSVVIPPPPQPQSNTKFPVSRRSALLHGLEPTPVGVMRTTRIDERISGPTVHFFGNGDWKTIETEHGTNSADIQKDATDRSTVLVVCVTRKPAFLMNIVNNFNRQTYENKKLCIVLNMADPSAEDVRRFLQGQVPDAIVISEPTSSLGECLNKGVGAASGDVRMVAKFDDDDFYGSTFLETQVMCMTQSKADVVGRNAVHAYIPEEDKLIYMHNRGHSFWTNKLNGATLLIHISVFKTVRFQNINSGETSAFLNDVMHNKMRCYAGPETDDFIIIRHTSNDLHVESVDIKRWLRSAVIITGPKLARFKNNIVGHILSPDDQTSPIVPHDIIMRMERLADNVLDETVLGNDKASIDAILDEMAIKLANQTSN